MQSHNLGRWKTPTDKKLRTVFVSFMSSKRIIFGSRGRSPLPPSAQKREGRKGEGRKRARRLNLVIIYDGISSNCILDASKLQQFPGTKIPPDSPYAPLSLMVSGTAYETNAMPAMDGVYYQGVSKRVYHYGVFNFF